MVHDMSLRSLNTTEFYKDCKVYEIAINTQLLTAHLEMGKTGSWQHRIKLQLRI